ncbi:hypothetical protein [Clostridium frigidicarnis]|uniref:PIN domain-containing protein n=1 Tax=Clostridium frigidicarnis TaxID=84698 RepID=A0A1I0XPZ8_9CLOT|nr:hypothetical protein [Clostridium frigidicarnis]SFB02360.1 hypothetical protein SAMN04488528_100925 [Clostridium frigidicarnis]
MVNKEYLLDTNIVIKVWQQYPSLFQDIESQESIDFKIYHSIAKELYIKEVRQFHAVPVLTDKFIKLLDHIINEDEIKFSEIYKPNVSIKYDSNKQIYYINGNKLSTNDYKLICICENYKQYTLVTEDKKMLNSVKIILDPSRVLTFNEFLCDLQKFNVL